MTNAQLELIKQIKTIIKYDKPYDFLRTNPHLQDHIILIGLGGSYAYGTNTPDSDIDIRGIAVNSKKELLLQTDFEQVVDTETDTTIYSFQKMIKLLTGCNPNTIEILGLEPEQYLYLSPIGKKLLENKQHFLSKRAIYTFGGYANQQLYRLKQLCTHNMNQSDLEQHILRTLQHMQDAFPETFKAYGDGRIRLYIDESEREDMQTEIYMDANINHYPLRDYCGQWNQLQNIVKSYNKIGHRNNNAKEHKKIAKHMMHLVRLNYMCLDILNHGVIQTYRKHDLRLLNKIRQGEYITADNQIDKYFYQLVKEQEARLDEAKKTTKLPDEPNYEAIHQLVMDVHESIIKKKERKKKYENASI